MRVCVVLEQRFSQTPDGAVWTDGPFPRSFWHRYLTVFDQVHVVARIRPAANVESGWQRSDEPRVTFSAVPCYVGPGEYLRKARAVRRAVRGAVSDRDAVILNVPSNLGTVLFPSLLRRGHPCSLEVVGDPYDSLAPGAVRHLLRPLFRWWFWRSQRWQCRRATAAAYVTAEALQRRYPPGPTTFATFYSNIELPVEAIVGHPRDLTIANGHPSTLVSVGYLSHLYKAPDVLIDAVALCERRGCRLRLKFVGDGKYRELLERRSIKRGVAHRVEFLGQFPSGESVRSILDQSDIFVLPSRQEGLPRALVEAMARGLPCIGSTVGGFSELLPPEDLVPPGNVEALASKIQQVVSDPQRLVRMSERNLAKSRDYTEEVLGLRREEFYEYVRSTTAKWQGERGA